MGIYLMLERTWSRVLSHLHAMQFSLISTPCYCRFMLAKDAIPQYVENRPLADQYAQKTAYEMGRQHGEKILVYLLVFQILVY